MTLRAGEKRQSRAERGGFEPAMDPWMIPRCVQFQCLPIYAENYRQHRLFWAAVSAFHPRHAPPASSRFSDAEGRVKRSVAKLLGRHNWAGCRLNHMTPQQRFFLYKAVGFAHPGEPEGSVKYCLEGYELHRENEFYREWPAIFVLMPGEQRIGQTFTGPLPSVAASLVVRWDAFCAAASRSEVKGRVMALRRCLPEMGVRVGQMYDTYVSVPFGATPLNRFKAAPPGICIDDHLFPPLARLDASPDFALRMDESDSDSDQDDDLSSY